MGLGIFNRLFLREVGMVLFLSLGFVYGSKTIVISSAPGDQVTAHVISDGENFFVVWSDGRDGHFNIYGARVSFEGDVLDPSGIQFTNSTKDDKLAQIAYDPNDSLYSIVFNRIIVSADWDTLWEGQFTVDAIRFTKDITIIDSVPIVIGESNCEPCAESPSILYAPFPFSHFIIFHTGFQIIPNFEIHFWVETNLLETSGDTVETEWESFFGYERGIVGAWDEDRNRLFVIYDALFQTIEGVRGLFIYPDSIVGPFLIREYTGLGSADFYARSERDKDMIQYGEGYLYLSETGGGWSGSANSSIWFDSLNSEGLPIDSVPSIIKVEDSVTASWPQVTYGLNSLFFVWQDSSSSGVDIYGAFIDSDGFHGPYPFLDGPHIERDPSLAYGGGKFLLVWSDNRNGDFDIYGELIDALNIKETLKKEENLRVPFSVRPTPFSQNLSVNFFLPRDGLTQIRLFDVSGRLVRLLFSGNLEKGFHHFIWDGKDEEGRRLGSGLYFVELETPGFSSFSKVLKVSTR